MTTVDAFAAGRARLSARMMQVLQLIADGKTDPEIAQRLGIGIGTAKSHVKRLFRALGATTRAQAVASAFEMGVLLPSGVDPMPPDRTEAALAAARQRSDVGEQLVTVLRSLGWTSPGGAR